MSPTPRFSRLACLACVLLCVSGCGAMDEGYSVPGGPPPPSGFCAVDQDCPDPDLFICDTTTSRCEAACRTREDCRGERRGLHALAVCDKSGGMGCQCDMNRCVPAVCATDSDCGEDGVCRDGACGPPPSASLAEACEVTPDVVVGSPGLSVDFRVWVRDASGRPVVLRDGIAWEALTSSVVGSGSGAAGTFVLAEPASEHAAVAVRVGRASCQARVTVLPPEVPPGGVRVVVVDALTGRPVPLALVAVSDDDGELTGALVTNAEGATWVPASGEVGLTAYHPDYGYLTLARHDASRFRDVRLALRRNPLDRFGGVQGTFPAVDQTFTTSTSLRMGLTGLSVPGLPSELSSESLLGPEREVALPIGQGPSSVSLPSGSALWLTGSAAPEVAAPGIAGVCDSSLPGVGDVEQAIRSGACGTRTAWALTGAVPLKELPLIVLQPGVDPLLQLGRLLPGSTGFYSTLTRDARFTLAPTPGIGTGEPDLSAVEYAQPLPFAPDAPGVRLSFPFAVRVPPLPQYQGAYLARAYVLATVSVPGRGMVPLGLGAAANVSPADPNTDADARLGRPGQVAVRMAPAHQGLEGQPYRLVVTAAGSQASDGSVATSTLVVGLPGPRFDPEGHQPVDAGVGFLAIPESARYNFDGDPYQGLEGRELKATVDPRASLVRAEFSTRAGRRWTVLMTPDDTEDGVRVPRPPLGVEDRTYDSVLLGGRSRLHVEVLRASGLARREGDGPAVLAAADGPGMERLADLLDAISVLRLGRPEVVWRHPEADGQRLARGSAVRVGISGFRLGSAPTGQGAVRVTLRGGSGCEGQVLTSAEPIAPGRGEVELELPAECSGLDVTLVATLVDSDGDALRPLVTATRRVDIP
ncbi:carboxypeptidase regulatory-like domain-containing protein [Myxococcus sp. Y35]|uniref:carboxypeptidase regulatory-like domain-containing protein n=1 Tax=Pseudomyxococcus flavus TaxID=3115648 RepID=UPI003CF66636